MVVEEYLIGNSRIRIHDDCMPKTEEENQKVLDHITKLVNRHYELERLERMRQTKEGSA